MNEAKKKKVIKTWSRRSMITPDFVGHTFAVHNGNKFIPVFINENMVGQFTYDSPSIGTNFQNWEDILTVKKDTSDSIIYNSSNSQINLAV